MTKQDVRAIVEALKELYPDSLCSLQYEKDYELLFAVRLSAQCTDERVNKVTPALYERFPTLESFAEADIEEVGQYIHSCGFFRGKSRDLVLCAQMLLSEYGGKVLKIAMAEAEGESVEGKALVMLVVLNRVWSEDFPGTIEDVVFQPRQFSPVREGGRYYTTEPDRECYEALELVMQGWDESGGALYFESCDKDSWHSENLEFLYQYGNHKFYR